MHLPFFAIARSSLMIRIVVGPYNLVRSAQSCWIPSGSKNYTFLNTKSQDYKSRSQDCNPQLARPDLHFLTLTSMPCSRIIIVTLWSGDAQEMLANWPVKWHSLQSLYHHPPLSTSAQWRFSDWSLSWSFVLKNIPTWYDSESPEHRKHART